MRKRGRAWLVLGALLLLGAAGLVCANLLADGRAALDAAAVVEQLPREQADDDAAPPDYLLDPDRDLPLIEVNGTRYAGTLSIPALGLELPVAAAWSYATLRTAPCIYTGTPYRNDMVICAHNYRSHFGRLSELEEGTEVVFTDNDGNRFRYAVAGLEILRPTAVAEMVDSAYDLTLFTCTLGGQTRMTIRCVALDPR